jgi:hypothetical protein
MRSCCTRTRRPSASPRSATRTTSACSSPRSRPAAMSCPLARATRTPCSGGSGTRRRSAARSAACSAPARAAAPTRACSPSVDHGHAGPWVGDVILAISYAMVQHSRSLRTIPYVYGATGPHALSVSREFASAVSRTIEMTEVVRRDGVARDEGQGTRGLHIYIGSCLGSLVALIHAATVPSSPSTTIASLMITSAMS